MSQPESIPQRRPTPVIPRRFKSFLADMNAGYELQPFVSPAFGSEFLQLNDTKL